MLKVSEVPNAATLSPYRILDITDEKAWMCGQLLGSLGAEVIKLEPPGGDPARRIGPFVHDIEDPERSIYWLAFNTNKKGITLNLESPQGRVIFSDLVCKSDAILETFKPGYLKGIGLEYAKLNRIKPGIILTSISPYGQEGPYKDYKATDLECWAMGGALFTCNNSDSMPYRVSHVPQSYIQGSLDGAWSTAMALYWKGLSGSGQHIDISIQESIERCALSSHVTWKLTGQPYQQCGPNYAVFPLRLNAPPAMWKVQDGYVRYTIYTGEQGARMNRPVIDWMASEGIADEFLTSLDWSTLSWEDLKRQEIKNITGYYSRFFARKNKNEIMEQAKERQADVEPVNTVKEILKHPQFQDSAYFQRLSHPEIGPIAYPGGFCRFSNALCQQFCRAPHIGEHNMKIYHEEMGISRKKINELNKMGII